MRGTRTIEKSSTKMQVGILLTKPQGVFPSVKLAHTIQIFILIRKTFIWNDQMYLAYIIHMTKVTFSETKKPQLAITKGDALQQTQIELVEFVLLIKSLKNWANNISV